MAKKKIGDISEEARKLILLGASIPDMADVVKSFFEEIGGAKEYGKQLHKEFKAALPGSPQRARLFELVGNMISRIKDVEREDLSLLSDEDLEHSLEEIVGKAMNSVAEEAE